MIFTISALQDIYRRNGTIIPSVEVLREQLEAMKALEHRAPRHHRFRSNSRHINHGAHHPLHGAYHPRHDRSQHAGGYHVLREGVGGAETPAHRRRYALLKRVALHTGNEIGASIQPYELPRLAISEDYRARLAAAIRKSAAELGIDPMHLAAAIHYETAGTFDPWKRGPTTCWGVHHGLIQWGEPQARQYGVGPQTSVEAQMEAVTRYLRDRGLRPGMGLLDIYSTINAGSPGCYRASDGYGTVASHVQKIEQGSMPAASALLKGHGPDTPGRFLSLGDSIAVGIRTHVPEMENRLPGNLNYEASRVYGAGHDPLWILNTIKSMSPNELAGRTVILSSGASNTGSPGALGNPGVVNQYVPQQIEALKQAGADVVLLGVGPRVGGNMDEVLRKIAEQHGVRFQPLVGSFGDGIHPSDPHATFDQIVGARSERPKNPPRPRNHPESLATVTV